MAALRWILGTITLFGLMLGAVLLLPSSDKDSAQITLADQEQKLEPQSIAPPTLSDLQPSKAQSERAATPRNVGRGIAPVPLEGRFDNLERVEPRERPAQPKPKAVPERLSGVIVTSAGQLNAQGKTIVLAGITPTTPEQKCGIDASQWPCGTYARTALRRFVRERSIVCILSPQDVSATTRCALGRTDVALWLATHGWVEAEAGSSYEALTEAAKANKIGIFGDAP